MQGLTLCLNFPVYWVEIFQNVTHNLLSQNYINLLHLYDVQSYYIQKTISKVIIALSMLNAKHPNKHVNDVILNSLRHNIET